MTAITTLWGDIKKEIRKYIVKEGLTEYELYTVGVGGAACKATSAEVKANAKYLKGLISAFCASIWNMCMIHYF